MSRRPQRQRKLREKTRRPRLRLVKNELPPAEIPAIAEPPSRFTMERVLCDFGGALGVNAKRDAWWQAQELAYRAMEMKDGEASIELAMQAVQLHPHCLDALTILAQASSGRNQQELIEHMRNIVDTGRRNLGEKFFEENSGHFWGILETRPYMRAHAYLAQLFVEAGEADEAVKDYECLLALNPNDNQGLRYPLLGCYLESGSLDGVRGLFEAYEDEDSAMFAWARVLERLLSEDKSGATVALAEARKVNAHVEAYVVGKNQVPRRLPDFYGFGDENEAVICADALAAAWKRHPSALCWLQQAG